MTPREPCSAGKRRTKGLSRQGEQRLRKLFALGAATLTPQECVNDLAAAGYDAS